MRRADRVLALALRVYLALFFVYLFLPLLYMMAAAFNRSSIPTLSPWRGFTLGWFATAWNDDRLWQALGTSFLIGGAVVVVSILLGLGGALLLTRLQLGARNLIYAVL